MNRGQRLATSIAVLIVLAGLGWTGAALLLDDDGSGRSGLARNEPAGHPAPVALSRQEWQPSRLPDQSPGQAIETAGRPGQEVDAILDHADRMLSLAPAVEAQRDTLNDLIRRADAIMARIDHLQARQDEYGRALAEMDGEAETMAATGEALAQSATTEALAPSATTEALVPEITAEAGSPAATAEAGSPSAPAMMAAASIPEVPVPDALPVPPMPAEDTYREASVALPPAVPPIARALPAPAPAAAPAQLQAPVAAGRSSAARRAVPAASSQPVASATQRRCQMITLLVQLGEEATNADRRFLRQGCR